jgi:uncharacterized protein YjbI with pentapeptide repeats
MIEAIYEKTFTDVDYTNQKPNGNEFARCIFKNCNFSNCDFTNLEFMDTQFDNCNLSMIKTANTQLKNVKFINCKMIGIDLSICNSFLLAVGFDKCILDYSTFQRKKIKNTIFNDCAVKEVDFTEADLTSSGFLNCDLTRSTFQNTILEKADFRTARNYSFDLNLNRVKKAKFSTSGVIGLLDKYQIIIE